MAHFRAVAHADAAAATAERVGVLLVNLGTPDSPSYFAVQRYLRQFLGDRRVIETSRLIWLPLLYGVVLPFRPIKTVRKYRKIWMRDGSPLAVYSRLLTAKVGAVLRARFGDGIRVELGMTYGNPGVARAVKVLAEQNVKKLLVLPMYPQYCSSTTGSVFDRTAKVLQRWRWIPETRFVNDYHRDPGYVAALTTSIENHWKQAGERSHLLFSYHGIPAVYVQEGDPYQAQAEATTRLVVARLGLAEGDFSHCYQSRFGSVVWLQPYTEDTLKELAKRGLRKLTVVSPSFAVDCLETLEEVAIEYRDKFLELGGEELTLVPCLNDDDRHAEALADIVQGQLGGWIGPS
ncbi:MAG: protoporphyrin/coproporphyrin ferrochelatase [Gammaproteobacteria bacterium]|nr:protoporphyrin/coproporphyrin ferrochelatase [Gammaproteobacteria bacterium]